MIPEKPQKFGRVTTKSSVRPPVEVDCTAWGAEGQSAQRTTARFATMSRARDVIQVSCAEWGGVQRAWDQLQELIEHLDQSYNGDPGGTVDHLKPAESLIGTVLKIAARAFRDQGLRNFICDLLVTAVYGDIREVGRILQRGDENESRSLAHLHSYALQIFAGRQRDLNEGKEPDLDEGKKPGPEQSTSRADQLW